MTEAVKDYFSGMDCMYESGRVLINFLKNEIPHKCYYKISIHHSTNNTNTYYTSIISIINYMYEV